MRMRLILTGIIGTVIVIAALLGSWLLLHRANICPLSGRVIHKQARAYVTIGGRNYETCCLRCALIEAEQTGKRLRVREVADFDTGRLLDPQKAWYVEGSDVNLCMRTTRSAQNPSGHGVYLRAFDRCSPSVYAFKDEQHARAFMAQRGGVLKRLGDLLQETEPSTGKAEKP
jgi:hypothetical protein